MESSVRTTLLSLLATAALAACGTAGETTVTSSQETVGTITGCCSLADGDWSMDPVGQTGNQATLSYKGEERGFIELREGSYDAVSDREGFIAITLAGRVAAIRRPDGNGQALMALIGNVNEHPEHLSIQIRCETVSCPEFESLAAELILQPVFD
jgi:hypothetical protein